MRLPRYRVWAGVTLWVGFSALDLLTVRSGVLSLTGFYLAFMWSETAPRRSGLDREMPSEPLSRACPRCGSADPRIVFAGCFSDGRGTSDWHRLKMQFAGRTEGGETE